MGDRFDAGCVCTRAVEFRERMEKGGVVFMAFLLLIARPVGSPHEAVPARLVQLRAAGEEDDGLGRVVSRQCLQIEIARPAKQPKQRPKKKKEGEKVACRTRAMLVWPFVASRVSDCVAADMQWAA